MSEPLPLPLHGDERLRTAVLTGTRWLDRVTCWRPRDPDGLVTGEHETAAILLAGTFDLVGGTSVWPARGARTEPFAGRPMVVFLPPHSEFRTSNGHGEILLLAARQPVARAEPVGREALARKPLLPLAGSGKAFDPNSGEWRPAETFPTAPESLPPRRFERIPIGPLVLERVFAPDYKAATLALDELVLPAGTSLAFRDVPGHPQADELLVFVRVEASAQLGTHPLSAGDHAWCGSTAEFGAMALEAREGRVYVALAYAGKPTN